MAFNLLSGAIAAPAVWDQPIGALTTQISGNLTTSDAANVINVPRVANSSNNGLITNVGGDANTLTCESNLKFDGTTLNITGDLTASAGASILGPLCVSSSVGMCITGSITPSGSNIFSLGSPSNRWKELYVGTGSIHIGSNGAMISSNEAADTIMFNKPIEVTGTMAITGNINLDGDLLPTVANVHNLGSAEKPWGSLYVSSSTIYFGEESLSVKDNNLKFGSGSATKGFDIGFMNFKNNGIFMDPGKTFQLRAYHMRFFGGVAYVRKVVAASYSVKNSDFLVGIQSDTMEAPIVLTLPPATSCENGQVFTIKDEGGQLNVHNATVAPSPGDVIDGQNTLVLESPYASISLYCNGIDKYFVY